MGLPELWTALLSGQYHVANQMSYNRANVNETRKTEIDSLTTLLHYAVLKKSDVRLIRALANVGADFNARDSWNRTPLHWAAMYEAHPDVVEVLIDEGAVLDARDNYQFTPLHHAVRNNNCVELAKKLIARGASIDAINEDGSSVMHMAVNYHNVEMVKVLISHRVNIDARDYYGNTPLLCFFKKGKPHSKITQLLLENGADVNAKTYGGSFSSLLVAKYSRAAHKGSLLGWGACINEAAFNGDTALHMACKKRLANVTALLLKFGADLNACNQESKTPFELLPISPNSEATAQIIIREAIKREALGHFLCEGYKQMAQSCVTYSRFEQECREEIKRMQNEKIVIEDSAVSFFYIFTIDEEKLSALARNEKIVTAFDSSGHVASFRVYAGELVAKFEVAKKRANFLMSVEDWLGVDVLGDILSASIVKNIVAYLKYGDITENYL